MAVPKKKTSKSKRNKRKFNWIQKFKKKIVENFLLLKSKTFLNSKSFIEF